MWKRFFNWIDTFLINWDSNVSPIAMPMNTPDPTPSVALLWNTDPLAYVVGADGNQHPYSVNGRHSVRVLCDDMGLTVAEKNVIAACVMQESGFMNLLPDGTPVFHENMVGSRLASTDWGIVQCNDYWHIGPKSDFPSVQYVVDNPEVMVRWMIQLSKEGKLNLWASYGPTGNGPYKQWLNKV